MYATTHERITGRTERTTPVPLRTSVVLGSTRHGRAGGHIAQWFTGHAQSRPGLTVDLVDLAEFPVPFHGPSGSMDSAVDFTSRIGQSDAIVIVTPEYNHGYPAALKQAIDSGCDEWFAKPVGFVAYGFSSRGLRAVEQLRLVFASLHVMTVPDVVSFNLVDAAAVDGGVPRDSEANLGAVQQMLAQLEWWARALRKARAEHPYPV